jgi:signal transduction histidine kinase
VPRIFEPFGQDSRAIGLNGVGVGIGLPVVRVLVKELGGTVVAESAGNGRGSRFVVTLPLAATAPAAPGAPDSTAVTVGSVPHGSR